MVKIVYCVRRRADVPAEKFHEYWLEKHGPLLRQYAKTLKARKYIQSHTIDTELNQRLTASRGMSEPYDGITEVWRDSIEDLQSAFVTPEGRAVDKELTEDESRFIDLADSKIFLTEEHTIFAY
jgi:uncharacterized protein (TIGR02118 family)